MTKLEETLDLFEKTENYEPNKNLLNNKISELLKEHGFKRVKEEEYLKLYAKGEEIFAKLGNEEYCWAKPKILKEELNYPKVYKELKKVYKPSNLQFLELLGVSLGTVPVGGYILHNLVLNLYKFPQYFAYAMAGLTAFSLVLFRFGFDHLVEHNKKKFEKSCEEIFYDKEALEKAFKR